VDGTALETQGLRYADGHGVHCEYLRGWIIIKLLAGEITPVRCEGTVVEIRGIEWYWSLHLHMRVDCADGEQGGGYGHERG
jgi:hypothetical protein